MATSSVSALSLRRSSPSFVLLSFFPRSPMPCLLCPPFRHAGPPYSRPGVATASAKCSRLPSRSCKRRAERSFYPHFSLSLRGGVVPSLLRRLLDVNCSGITVVLSLIERSPRPPPTIILRSLSRPLDVVARASGSLFPSLFFHAVMFDFRPTFAGTSPIPSPLPSSARAFLHPRGAEIAKTRIVGCASAVSSRGDVATPV